MPPKYNLATPVIFRMLGDNPVAIFPTMPADTFGLVLSHEHCLSFETIGHYGSWSMKQGQRARLATHAEYIELKKELQRMGYRLKVVKRIAAAHNRERKNAIQTR